MRHRDPSKATNINQTTTDDPYGFFIYFFDEIQGHVPLFAYPQELLDNKHEKKIISIHSIWWHQDKFIESEKFISMDLELEGVIYCATLVQCKTRRTKRRSGMDSKKWQAERFVLIVKAPSAVSFIAQEILHELKTRIQGSFSENLCFLVENYLKFEKESEIGDYLKKKATNIEQQLANLCISLIPKIPISQLDVALEEIPREEALEPADFDIQHPSAAKSPRKPQLRFSIPMGKSSEIEKAKPEVALVIEPKRVKLVAVKRNKDDNLVKVTLRNNSSDLIVNALLKIYKSQGFFSKDILVSKIKEWPPENEVYIEFTPENMNGIIYFLKVEDEKGTIKVKRILG
jgi:hypothetical protein